MRGAKEKVFPKGSVEDNMRRNSQLLLLRLVSVDKVSKPGEEVASQGDYKGHMVELSHQRVNAFISNNTMSFETAKLQRPDAVLVNRETNLEEVSVKHPSQDNLFLGWGSFLNQFRAQENISMGNWFGRTGMRATGTVHGKWDNVRLLRAVFRGVEETVDKVSDKTINPGSVCDRNTDGHW